MFKSTHRRTGLVALVAAVAVLSAACRPATPPASPSPTLAQPTLAPTAETVVEPTTAPQVEAVSSDVDMLAGQWEGGIDVAGQRIGIIVRFTVADGEVKGLIDIPQQGAKDLPLNNIKVELPGVYFEMLSGPSMAAYEGEVQPDGATITGTFKQAGFVGTFDLARAAVETVETALLPYVAEEVTFTNGDAKLAGTLTLPEGDGPFPAVVLISGSGQQNRDEDIFGFKVFGVIADHLTRNGIAVLRYDDRGIGGSTGDVENATSEDFANDVAAAVALLKTKPAIDPNKIGLLGHSEGGIIAPLVVSNTQEIGFVILMAGPGVPGTEVLREQVPAIMKADGATDAQIQEALDEQMRLFEAVRTGQGWEQLEAKWREQVQASIDAMSDEQRKQLGDIEDYVETAVKNMRRSVDNAWLRFFLFFDPAQALSQARVPVLALFGELDLQVLPATNEAAVVRALKDAGNADVTSKVFPGANHLFQPAKTGSPTEYATLPKEFVPGFLDTISEWILARVR